MDPTTQTFLVWLFGFIPAPYNTYAASVIGILGIMSVLASAISAKVKPPAADSAKWVQGIYKVVTWPALNFGWARNAVVPGMPAIVQQAAKEAAVIAAKIPEATVIAGTAPNGAAVISTVDALIDGTVPLKPANGA